MAKAGEKPAKKKNIKTEADAGDSSTALPPEQMKQIGKFRETLLTRLGQVVLMFCGVSRYAHQPISELQRLCVAPMMRDRIAIAMGGELKDEDGNANLASPLLGIAIWANVSEEVDEKIQEQVREGVFPVRINAKDWNSGDIVWLLDVIAPSRKVSQTVLANFRRVLKAQKIDLPDGQIRLHPIIKRTLGEDVLKSMGAMTMEEVKKQESATQDAKGESLH